MRFRSNSEAVAFRAVRLLSDGQIHSKKELETYIKLNNPNITSGTISGALFEFMRMNGGRYFCPARAKYKLASVDEVVVCDFKARAIKVLKNQLKVLNSVCAVNAAGVADNDLKIANRIWGLVDSIKDKISEIEM